MVITLLHNHNNHLSEEKCPVWWLTSECSNNNRMHKLIPVCIWSQSILGKLFNSENTLQIPSVPGYQY